MWWGTKTVETGDWAEPGLNMAGKPMWPIEFKSTPGDVSEDGLSSGVLEIVTLKMGPWTNQHQGGKGTYSGCGITMNFRCGAELTGKLQESNGKTEMLWSNGVIWTRSKEIPAVMELCSAPATKPPSGVDASDSANDAASLAMYGIEAPTDDDMMRLHAKSVPTCGGCFFLSLHISSADLS